MTNRERTVDVAGRPLLLLNADFAATLHFHGETRYETCVRLASPFRLRMPSGETIAIDPQDIASPGGSEPAIFEDRV